MEYTEALQDDLRAMPPLPGMAPPKPPKQSAPAAAASSSAVAPARGKDVPVASAFALSPEGRPVLIQAVDMLCAESPKFAVLASLLRMHSASGHRTLIFSQSLRMLAFVTLLLARLDLRHLRIDGTVNDPAERQRRVERFNRDESIDAFLLTTRAGGVGLNLTGASRVVILDPDWAPALDNQAVDRAYRLGQKHNVVVYRFITAGTVEEVIYRKQVFKGSVIRAATGVKNPGGGGGGGEDAIEAPSDALVPGGPPPPAAAAAASGSGADAPTRYFNREELREVFAFTSSTSSRTFDSLRRMHPPHLQRRSYPELDKLAQLVEAVPGVHGITDHDLLFKQAVALPDEPNVSAAVEATATNDDHEEKDDDDPSASRSSIGVDAALEADAQAEHQEALDERVEAVVALATARTLSHLQFVEAEERERARDRSSNPLLRSPAHVKPPRKRSSRSPTARGENVIDLCAESEGSSSDDEEHDDEDGRTDRVDDEAEPHEYEAEERKEPHEPNPESSCDAHDLSQPGKADAAPESPSRPEIDDADADVHALVAAAANLHIDGELKHDVSAMHAVPRLEPADAFPTEPLPAAAAVNDSTLPYNPPGDALEDQPLVSSAAHAIVAAAASVDLASSALASDITIALSAPADEVSIAAAAPVSPLLARSLGAADLSSFAVSPVLPRASRSPRAFTLSPVLNASSALPSSADAATPDTAPAPASEPAAQDVDGLPHQGVVLELDNDSDEEDNSADAHITPGRNEHEEEQQAETRANAISEALSPTRDVAGDTEEAACAGADADSSFHSAREWSVERPCDAGSLAEQPLEDVLDKMQLSSSSVSLPSAAPSASSSPSDAIAVVSSTSPLSSLIRPSISPPRIAARDAVALDPTAAEAETVQLAELEQHLLTALQVDRSSELLPELQQRILRLAVQVRFTHLLPA
jgi:hypothetical protein